MKKLIAIFIAMALMQNNASASYSYSWSTTGVSAEVGTPIEVSLYLNDSIGVGGNIDLNGVQFANLQVASSFGALDLPTMNLDPMEFGFDTDFSTTDGSTSSVAFVNLGSLFGAGIGSGGSLKLATFTINSPTAGSGTLSLSTANNSANDVLVVTGFDEEGALTFDAIGLSVVSDLSFNYDFQTAAVPEPISIATSSVLAAGGAWYARRRKLKQKKMLTVLN